MPRWLKIVLGIAAGLAVVIAIAVTVALWATSGLIEPIERQLAALKAGNIEAAYAETSEAFHQATPIDKFTAFVDQFPILKDVAVAFLLQSLGRERRRQGERDADLVDRRRDARSNTSSSRRTRPGRSSTSA